MSDSMREAVRAKLQSAPQIDLVDEAAKETWEDIKAEAGNAYEKRIVAFADDWARLMQLEIAAGKQLADVANTTKQEANYDGVTYMMTTASVGMLARLWRHGAELRLWHNARFLPKEQAEEVSAKGGIVAPPIIGVDN